MLQTVLPPLAVCLVLMRLALMLLVLSKVPLVALLLPVSLQAVPRMR